MVAFFNGICDMNLLNGIVWYVPLWRLKFDSKWKLVGLYMKFYQENYKVNLLASFQVNMYTAMLPDLNIIYTRSIRPDQLKLFSCLCSQPFHKNRSSLPFCFFHYSSKHIRLMQQPRCANTCYLQKVIFFVDFYIFMFWCILCVWFFWGLC